MCIYILVISEYKLVFMRFIPTNISIAVNTNNIHNNGTWQHGKCKGETMGNQNGFSSGWWLGHPSEKYGP